MKKILIALTIAISCLGISRVSADSVEFDYSYAYFDSSITNFNEFSSYLNKYEGKILELYRLLFEKYNAEYVNDYPYYLLQFSSSQSNIIISLVAFKSPIYLKSNGEEYGKTYYEDGTLLQNFDNSYVRLRASYSFDDGMYILPVVYNDFDLPAHYGLQGGTFHEIFFFDSNFDLKIYTDMDNIIIHNYRDTNSDFIINSGDTYPTLYKSGIFSITSYTEINLNDYAYVALVPKEFYSEEKITTVYVKGQYCLTPVYNFGLQERNDVLNGTKVQRCSVKYNDFTPVRTYLLNQDMDNKSIYYVKAYDTTIDNIIKVDNTVFDITYITEENKDEPYVYIQGKYYPTIPYDKLTDTATKSEEEGYNAGASCAVGDLNCQAQYSSSFGDIFDKPLETLKGVWDSIKNVFDLIVELLSLLPVEMQSFLYLSFMLLTIIGILKLIF